MCRHVQEDFAPNIILILHKTDLDLRTNDPIFIQTFSAVFFQLNSKKHFWAAMSVNSIMKFDAFFQCIFLEDVLKWKILFIYYTLYLALSSMPFFPYPLVFLISVIDFVNFIKIYKTLFCLSVIIHSNLLAHKLQIFWE